MSPIESLRALMGFLVNLVDILTNIAMEQETFVRINAERALKGVAPLQWQGNLVLGASGKGEDMDTLDYFAHECPARPTSDGAPFHFSRLLEAAGYVDEDGELKNTYMGEILAWGYDSPAAVVAGWKASPGHYAIMVDPNYTHVGISAVKGSEDGRIYWTGEFGGAA